MRVRKIDPQTVSIDERQVLQLLGYPEEARVAPAVTEALPRAIRAVAQLADPVSLVELREVQSTTRDAVHLASGPIFGGQRLALALRHAGQAALFALTLGERVSETVRALAADDPFESFLLDSVASILVESAADELQTRLEASMNEQGAWGGFRFSPGYCDWPTQENRALLQALDAQTIGVHLTAGGMMTPQKSISGIIGFASDPARIQVNPCPSCPRTDCDHRRASGA